MIPDPSINGPGYILADECDAPVQIIRRGFVCNICPDDGTINAVQDISLSAKRAGWTKDEICIDCYREELIQQGKDSKMELPEW